MMMIKLISLKFGRRLKIFFEMITEYYVKNKNLGVMVYQKGDIESENEDED